MNALVWSLGRVDGEVVNMIALLEATELDIGIFRVCGGIAK
jgi:hypothetical protein